MNHTRRTLLLLAGLCTMAQAQEDSTEPVLLASGGANDADTSAPPQGERQLIQRGIYRCLERGQYVFVDDHNRPGLSRCEQIRAPHYRIVNPDDAPVQGAAVFPSASPCSGAIIYRGGTYIFSDKAPCPIPAELFERMTPIEAHPQYYNPEQAPEQSLVPAPTPTAVPSEQSKPILENPNPLDNPAS